MFFDVDLRGVQRIGESLFYCAEPVAREASRNPRPERGGPLPYYQLLMLRLPKIAWC